MFEHKSDRLPSIWAFTRRMSWSIGAALCVVTVGLTIGAVGYHFTEGMPWLDAFLNASMILTGMGPVDRLQTESGKLFAILYSLLSGFIILTVSAIILGPVLHRLLHAFHLQDDADRSGT